MGGNIILSLMQISKVPYFLLHAACEEGMKDLNLMTLLLAHWCVFSHVTVSKVMEGGDPIGSDYNILMLHLVCFVVLHGIDMDPKEFMELMTKSNDFSRFMMKMFNQYKETHVGASNE